jgi:hypothetical protein
VAKAKPAKSSAPHNEALERLKRRYDTLKGGSERVNVEAHWQEIGEVISPRKVDFVGQRTRGEKQLTKVFDPTGILANDMLAAGLHGMATNPASKWFSLRIVGGQIMDENGQSEDLNEAPAVQQYLADVEDIMWQRIYQPGSNFTTAIHENYLDLGAFGTAVLYVGQRDDGGLMFEGRSLAECVFAENSEGRVDTVFRKTSYTVRQMKQMQKQHGWTISDRVEKLYEEEKFDDDVVVIHAVYPRVEREYGKKDVSNMPWASCYFEHESCEELEMSGFPEFPYLVSRWSKYAGELYGRGPGMTALPDVKMLQAMALTKIKLLQKAADPPMWLRDDGVVGGTRTMPGGINYWRGNPNDGVMLQPVSMQGIQAIVEDIQNIREQVLKVFYADLMRMTDRADMTATEVIQRTSEQMRLFGPLIGRLESEMLGPLVERVFGILTRQGLLPEAPQEIQGHEFTVEYVSPIATAQKQQSANGIVQVMQLISMFGPDAAMQVIQTNLDVNKLFAWLWDLFNNDPDLLKDNEQIAQAMQVAQTQMGLNLGQPAAQIAERGGKAVKAVTDAATAQGVDVQALIQQLGGMVGSSPKAQNQLRGMMEGAGMEAPDQAMADEMAAGAMQ